MTSRLFFPATLLRDPRVDRQDQTTHTAELPAPMAIHLDHLWRLLSKVARNTVKQSRRLDQMIVDRDDRAPNRSTLYIDARFHLISELLLNDQHPIDILPSIQNTPRPRIYLSHCHTSPSHKHDDPTITI
jgi:hypothetical protein